MADTDTAPAAAPAPDRADELLELDDFLGDAPISTIDRAVLNRLHPGARTRAAWVEAIDTFNNKGI